MSQPYASSPAGSAAGTPGSTAATADGNPSTPAKLSLGQLHTQIPAIFQRARTGNMSAAQAHQFRIMLYKSLPNLIVHSLKTGRPNPFIDIPDLLNPSVSSEGYTANITPEQYQHRIQLTEHEARKKLIKSGDLPPDNTTEVAGASEGTSGDAQGEGGNGENGGTDASTAANTLATAHASASGDMQGVPARTASPAFQNLPTSEVINIFRMTNAERDEAFKRDPVLQNRYNLTLHKVLATTRKQQNPGTAAAISAAIAALTPGSSSGSVGAASTGTSSPHIPGAGSATGTDDTGQGSTAASITAENVLPDASNFNLSLPPSVKAKKGLSNASNPSKAEDSSTLDGHSGNDETVKLEETDMDLDSRFGADPSVDMGRSTDMEAASGSGSSHGHALAAGRGKGSGNGVGSGPVELPSPFNLSSGSGGGSSSTNAAGASGSGPYAQLNYSARGQAGQDTYPGNRSGLPEGARSVGWERSTGTMGLQQGKQAAAPIQPSLRPQPLPLEPESARRKRKVREMLGEVAPGMEMEVGVDEVFEEYIEEFLRDLIRGGAELAKHRNVNGIELKDVGLYMQHRFNVSVPGYETLIPHKPSMPVGEPDRKARAKGIVPGYNRKPNGDTQGIPGGGA